MDLILALGFMGMALGVLLTVLMQLDAERGTRPWWRELRQWWSRSPSFR